MKLDKDTLLNEVAGHQDRMSSPLWSKDGGEPDGDWTQALRSDPPAPRTAVGPAPTYHAPKSGSPSRTSSTPREQYDEPLTPRTVTREPSMTQILPRLDALDRAIEQLSALMARRSVGRDEMTDWPQGAAGDPHSYDGPDSARKGVCVRILPTTYAQLQATKHRMGLRTVAATWEFLLRLGFAAAERGLV